MKEFQRAGMPPAYYDLKVIAKTQKVTREEAKKIRAKFLSESVYLNDIYQVNKSTCRFLGYEMIHLSIKRRDKEAIHDWRHLQQIKNMLVGEECEGFELYPAESRLVDEANQYHLWVFNNTTVRMPVGDTTRKVGTPEEAAAHGAKQRPFE